MGPNIESLGLTELFFRFAVRDKLKKKKNFFHPISELRLIFLIFYHPSFPIFWASFATWHPVLLSNSVLETYM